jgi:hypothetical protein
LRLLKERFMSQKTLVTTTRQSGHQFLVDFGKNPPQWLADDPRRAARAPGLSPRKC